MSRGAIRETGEIVEGKQSVTSLPHATCRHRNSSSAPPKTRRPKDRRTSPSKMNSAEICPSRREVRAVPPIETQLILNKFIY